MTSCFYFSLETAKLCCDEKHLMVLSRQCEPDPNATSQPSAPTSKPPLQPSLPTTPMAPKFGTAEGQNISKMMSLCKEVKPHTEKPSKAPMQVLTAVSQSPVPSTIPSQLRSPSSAQRIPRNLIYQYVLQQQMTDIHAELRRRPIARLSAESSSVVPASLKSPGSNSRSQSSISSGYGPV